MAIGLVAIAIEFTLFMWFFVSSRKCAASILAFHDYLINYRLTPRSRIMRKHLPKMSMVMEEESQYE